MPLLECKGLVRRFGALVAVDNVDMSVEPGEMRAVIGPNGAGKSTLFNLITGVLKPSAGQVFFAGEDVTGMPVYRVAQKGIARTFQLCHVFPALTARENVRIAAQARDQAALALPRRRQRARSLGRRRRRGARAHAALPFCRRARRHAVARRPAPAGGRHGDRAEAAAAHAGRADPGPVDRGDRPGRADLKDLLAAGDLSVLLVEHDMEVVFRLADNITVLHRGRVIADGPPAAVRANAEVRSAYLGGSE